jgi:hypothetical protein
MNRALRITLLALAALVVLFVVTRVSVPSDTSSDVPPPASLFMAGLGSPVHGCDEYGTRAEQIARENAQNPGGSYSVLMPGADPKERACLIANTSVVGATLGSEDLDALRTRIGVIFGGAAAVVILVGIAFGAARRKQATTLSR